MYRRSYSKDPRWLIAGYGGIDVNGRRYAKGEKILYYPFGKRVVSGEAALEAFRRFEAEAFDEGMMRCM